MILITLFDLVWFALITWHLVELSWCQHVTSSAAAQHGASSTSAQHGASSTAAQHGASPTAAQYGASSTAQSRTISVSYSNTSPRGKPLQLWTESSPADAASRGTALGREASTGSGRSPVSRRERHGRGIRGRRQIDRPADAQRIVQDPESAGAAPAAGHG